MHKHEGIGRFDLSNTKATKEIELKQRLLWVSLCVLSPISKSPIPKSSNALVTPLVFHEQR